MTTLNTIITTGANVVEDVKKLFPCPYGECDGSGEIDNFPSRGGMFDGYTPCRCRL